MLDSLDSFLTTALGQYNLDQERKAQLNRDLMAFNENPYYGVDESGRVFKRGVATPTAAVVPGVSNTLLIGGALAAVLVVVLLARG